MFLLQMKIIYATQNSVFLFDRWRIRRMSTGCSCNACGLYFRNFHNTNFHNCVEQCPLVKIKCCGMSIFMGR